MFGTNARRAIAGAGIALMMAVGAGACGGGGGGDDKVDKDALTSKVKADSDLKDDLSRQKDKDKAVQCLVKAASKYGDKGRLQDYLMGKGDFQDVVKSDDQEKANKSVVSCMK